MYKLTMLCMYTRNWAQRGIAPSQTISLKILIAYDEAFSRISCLKEDKFVALQGDRNAWERLDLTTFTLRGHSGGTSSLHAPANYDVTGNREQPRHIGIKY